MNSREQLRVRTRREASRRHFRQEALRRDKVSPIGKLPRTLVEVHLKAVVCRGERAPAGDSTVPFEDMLTHGANVRLVMDAFEIGHCIGYGSVRCYLPSVRDAGGNLMYNGWCWRHAHDHPLWPDDKSKVPVSTHNEMHRVAVFRGISERDFMKGKRPKLTHEEAAQKAEALLDEWLDKVGHGRDGTSVVARIARYHFRQPKERR